MKKVITVIVLILFVLSFTVAVDASVAKERQKKTVKQVHYETVEQHYTEIVNITLQRGTTAPANYSEEVNRETTLEQETEEIDPFLDVQTDKSTTTITVKDVVYNVTWTDPPAVDPVVLDLNNDGKIDVVKNYWLPHFPEFNKKSAKIFDIDANGMDDLVEWMTPGPGDGLLVIPENGKVENAEQLFGTAEGYEDGLQKLSMVCDKDKNGWVEGEELQGLAIWVDSNNDAICQPNEIKKLSDYNIKRIATRHYNYVGKYETLDGQVHTLWNWWPTCVEARKFKRSK